MIDQDVRVLHELVPGHNIVVTISFLTWRANSFGLPPTDRKPNKVIVGPSTRAAVAWDRQAPIRRGYFCYWDMVCNRRWSRKDKMEKRASVLRLCAEINASLAHDTAGSLLSVEPERLKTMRVERERGGFGAVRASPLSSITRAGSLEMDDTGRGRRRNRLMHKRMVAVVASCRCRTRHSENQAKRQGA